MDFDTAMYTFDTKDIGRSPGKQDEGKKEVLPPCKDAEVQLHRVLMQLFCTRNHKSY